MRTAPLVPRLPVSNACLSCHPRDRRRFRLRGFLVRLPNLVVADGVEDPHFAITQLAQTTMRSEIGKLSLDETFRERDTLNARIVEAINAAAADWGIKCMRYEIRDISPPQGVRVAMEMQAEAERRKRALILDSQGEQEVRCVGWRRRCPGATRLDAGTRARGHVGKLAWS